jgi:RHS repeat-associated protein
VRETVGGTQVDYVGNFYEYSETTSSVPEQLAGALRYGINCYDSATGTGYLMYSEESVHERFSAYPPDANNADHFICVKYVSGQWKYDTGSSPYYYTFTPRTSDVLVAAINYTSDTITSLQGTNTSEYGIDKGYASGDLSYLADRWNGQVNDGEFSVQVACVGKGCPPQGFTPHRLITIRKYYYIGSTRIAMRSNEMLRYLFGDHLGSTSVVVKADGTQETERGYKPWGEQRFGSAGLTSYGFTGQKDVSLAGGIMFYGARYYDQSLGRFLSADSIVPNAWNPVAFDRYAYVMNSPIMYIDPSGHCPAGEYDDQCAQQLLDDPAIPDPTYPPCIPSPGTICITPGMDPNEQIALAIAGEGGSLSAQAAADILQTLLNRAYLYWTSHHEGINPYNRTWASITEDELTALLLFILSEPYTGKNGEEYPAFNAWGTPQSSNFNWFNDIQTGVADLLATPRAMPRADHAQILIGEVSPNSEVRNLSVLYFASLNVLEGNTDYWRPPSPIFTLFIDLNNKYYKYNVYMFFDDEQINPPSDELNPP